MRIKENDQVVVISGNDKGLRGKVLRVIPKKNRVVVSGVNVVKKHQRSKPLGGRGGQSQGGIIEFEAPIDVSNVMLVDPGTDEPTRIGVHRDENGRRVRYAKKSGANLD